MYNCLKMIKQHRISRKVGHYITCPMLYCVALHLRLLPYKESVPWSKVQNVHTCANWKTKTYHTVGTDSKSNGMRVKKNIQAIKVILLYFNVYLSVKLESFSCSFASISFLTNQSNHCDLILLDIIH